MTSNTKCLSVEFDEGYYRVILIHKTHKLHSEKLNLASAIELHSEIKELLK